MTATILSPIPKLCPENLEAVATVGAARRDLELRNAEVTYAFHCKLAKADYEAALAAADQKRRAQRDTAFRRLEELQGGCEIGAGERFMEALRRTSVCAVSA